MFIVYASSMLHWTAVNEQHYEHCAIVQYYEDILELVSHARDLKTQCIIALKKEQVSMKVLYALFSLSLVHCQSNLPKHRSQQQRGSSYIYSVA